MSEAGLHTLRMLAQRFKRFGLSAAWFKAEAEAGRIPCLKVGRRMLFHADAVETVLLDRAAQATNVVDSQSAGGER